MKDRKVILLVEDSPAQMINVKRDLEHAGLKVLWAPDGAAGIHMAKRFLPSAIVMDLELPDMNGAEVCKLLKRFDGTKDIPILVLTIHTEVESFVEAMGAGTVDFIPKDVFSNRVLIETLRQLNILDSN